MNVVELFGQQTLSSLVICCMKIQLTLPTHHLPSPPGAAYLVLQTSKQKLETYLQNYLLRISRHLAGVPIQNSKTIVNIRNLVNYLNLKVTCILCRNCANTIMPE